MKRFLLILTVLFPLVFAGCGSATHASTDTTVWYKTMDDAINHGMTQEHVSRANLLGNENVQGETLVFYQLNLALGIASLTKSDRGYSWQRFSPYSAFADKSHSQQFGYFVHDETTMNKHKIKVVSGTVYDSSIKLLGLYYNGTLLQSKQVNETPSVFYFLVADPQIDSTSLEVKSI